MLNKIPFEYYTITRFINELNYISYDSQVKFRYQLINIYRSLERTNLSRRTGVGFEFTVGSDSFIHQQYSKKKREKEGRETNT